MTLDELKIVAKNAMCTGSNKAQLIAELKKASKGQASFQRTGGQLKLSFDPKGNYANRERQFVRKILAQTGVYIKSYSCHNF